MLHLPFMNHFVHWMPADESKVLSYLWNHSMPRSSLTASQYQPMSLLAFSTSSRQPKMPCLLIKRETLLPVWPGTNANLSVNMPAFGTTFNVPN